MDTGMVPSAWKMARIIPIHKSGPTSDFDNYRPISVLPSVSNIIEKIVHKQLTAFLDEKNLIYSHQFGFRNKMCTEHAVTLLLDSIRQKVDEGNIVGACFVDLSKAFDTISHSNLLTKLPKYGIHGRELAWFTDNNNMIYLKWVAYNNLSTKREIRYNRAHCQSNVKIKFTS